jgi:tryptophanyl-tRNA synthetase
MSKIVFSGIQPSGNLHIGNYIGSLRQWVKSQEDGLNIFCIVDMHAITVPQDPEKLREKSIELVKIYIAAGIDPKKSLIFIQSHNPDHANLGWILNNFTSIGQLNRMTQYKDKSEGKDFVSVGLFDYPVLMAADIFLYDTTSVPVGEDQKQHIELARDIAEKFNTKFGQTFVLPSPDIPKIGGRIMSLVDPTKKMSKSDANPNATIYLLDEPEVARKKVMSATTDSDSVIKYDWDNKPGISNLIEIYSQIAEISSEDIEKEFAGKSYKDFKQEVAKVVSDFLTDFQDKYSKVDNNRIKEILESGAKKSYEISHKKLLDVYRKVGFVVNG